MRLPNWRGHHFNLAVALAGAMIMLSIFTLSRVFDSWNSKMNHESRSVLGSLLFFGPGTSSKAVMAAKGDCSVPTNRAREGMIKHLKIMSGKLSVSDPFVFFERNGTKLQASVEQPDHGQVTHLRLTVNGDIYAIGQQLSYKVILTPLPDGFSLQTKALPVLFGKPCGSIWKQLLSPCPEAKAIYSNALSSVFLSGYDSEGTFKSYVYGLKAEVIDLSKAPTPNYQHDCNTVRSIRAVKLVGRSGAAIMDKTGKVKPSL
jgi:hypothetical protein